MMGSMDYSPFPCEKVTHGSNGKVDDVVHATGVNSIDRRTPFVTLAPMGIESGKVQGGVTCIRNDVQPPARARQETAT